jgi:hypothetical protein
MRIKRGRFWGRKNLIGQSGRRVAYLISIDIFMTKFELIFHSIVMEIFIIFNLSKQLVISYESDQILLNSF